jgi:hypothetical protein
LASFKTFLSGVEECISIWCYLLAGFDGTGRCNFEFASRYGSMFHSFGCFEALLILHVCFWTSFASVAKNSVLFLF